MSEVELEIFKIKDILKLMFFITHNTDYWCFWVS